MIRRGEDALQGKWPQLTATAYAAYVRKGNRADYEAAYMARRRRLNALAMAELAEGDGRFLDAVADGIWMLCEESGWQLPAHNAQERGGMRTSLPDPHDPVVDLFAAETGAQISVVLSLLGDRLEIRLPGLRARAEAEIERRIIGPYLSRAYWWMGDVEGPTNNWTTWITQNVLLAALTQPIGPARRGAIVRRALRSLDAFLADYGEDGACEEGALYYRHAGLCLWGALDLLERAIPGLIAPVWSDPKIRNIAEYIEAVHVGGRRYINFADCPSVAGRCTVREVLFGRATGSDRLAAFAAQDAVAEGWDDLPDEINLWYRLLQAQHAGVITGQPPAAPPSRDVWYPSIGLLVARDGAFTLAVKAGDNGDSHNHNDVGSVTLYRNARPVLIDLGVETYTAKTFSDRRYEIWTMQSGWHNLPSFGGVMQAAGERYGARDVVPVLSDTAASIEMDIADAFPAEARLRHAHRRVTLEKGGSVEIKDRYDGDLPAELTLLFEAEPRLTPYGLKLDDLASFGIEGLEDVRITHVPIADPRLTESWPAGIWRLLGTVPGGHLKMVIS